MDSPVKKVEGTMGAIEVGPFGLEGVESVSFVLAEYRRMTPLLLARSVPKAQT